MDPKEADKLVVRTGVEAAQQALEYCGGLVADTRNPTAEESRAVIVAVCSCIASLNSQLLKNCRGDAYKEAQNLILSFMETAAAKIQTHTTQGGTDA